MLGECTESQLLANQSDTVVKRSRRGQLWWMCEAQLRAKSDRTWTSTAGLIWKGCGCKVFPVGWEALCESGFGCFQHLICLLRRVQSWHTAEIQQSLQLPGLQPALLCPLWATVETWKGSVRGHNRQTKSWARISWEAQVLPGELLPLLILAFIGIDLSCEVTLNPESPRAGLQHTLQCKVPSTVCELALYRQTQ